MTVDQAWEKAEDILPRKILQQHVREEDVDMLYGFIVLGILNKERMEKE